MLLYALFAHAQEVCKHPISPILLEVSYKLTQVCSLPSDRNPEGWKLSESLVLEVGDGISHSYVVGEQSKVMAQLRHFQEKNRWRTELFNIHALLGETFMGYPSQDVLTQVVNLDAAGIYQYVETIPAMGWAMQPGSKEILGYHCQQASCTFRGRDYEAWFTTDIPVAVGPWKFHGLPGLILEVREKTGLYGFMATGLSMVTGRNMEIYDMKLRRIKRTRALRMEAMLHKDHGAYVEDYGIHFKQGNGAEHAPTPYFPMELE